MAKKFYVFDTSVCLTDFNSVYSYGNNDIVIPFKVLDEIDNHKQRQDGVGSNARGFIRMLDLLREKGSIIKGARIEKGKGLLIARGYDAGSLPDGFDISVPDNQIIATALSLMSEYSDTKRKVVMVSRDINMRVKCDSLGILTEDYVKEQVVADRTDIYTGLSTVLVDDQLIDQFYDKEEVYLDPEVLKLYPNEFVMLVSSANEKKTAIGRFINYSSPLVMVPECTGSAKKKAAWGIKPRNKEQGFALNLLRDPSIDLVSLIGKAGSGKTLCAIAAGLEQVLERNSVYKPLIVSRSIQPMGKDLGYLPGTMEEKMMPWIAPLRDNLEYLFGDKTALDMHMDQGVVEIEAMTYIRGRSISNAFMIVDEAQNLTTHELKTIITRVGHGTKLILTGDVQQIDNSYVDAVSNGLTHAVEKFKHYEISGHITLHKGERSSLATLAAEIL